MPDGYLTRPCGRSPALPNRRARQSPPRTAKPKPARTGAHNRGNRASRRLTIQHNGTHTPTHAHIHLHIPDPGSKPAEATGQGNGLIEATGRGSSPIEAPKRALHHAPAPHCPTLAHLRLTHHQTRTPTSTPGTTTPTRVLAAFHDGQHHWRTTGTHTDPTTASWQALQDAFHHTLRNHTPPHSGPRPARKPLKPETPALLAKARTPHDATTTPKEQAGRTGTQAERAGTRAQ
ncbi:alpha-isopropylmalate synthase regulatory domain-containing protein [Streptomyces populi]